MERITLEYEGTEKFVSRALYATRAWNLLELLNSLYNLAVCDSVKFEIYETHQVGLYLKDIIFSGNDFEIEYALKLLRQLCFDKRVLGLVAADTDLYEKIKTISVGSADSSEAKGFRKACKVNMNKLTKEIILRFLSYGCKLRPYVYN